MEIEVNVENDCNKMNQCLNEKKGDEMISFLLHKNKRDRQAIRAGYKLVWGKELEAEVNRILSGNYRRTIIDLIRRPAERDAIYLYKAMKGIGKDEETIIEIICSKQSFEIEKIKEEYKLKYNGETLEKRIKEKLSGDFGDLILSILDCKRSENSMPNESECEALAKNLYDPEKKMMVVDSKMIQKVFVLSSPPEIFTINKYYRYISGKELKDDIEKQFSSYMKIALLTILEAIVDPSTYFAKRINKAVKGIGTNDKMLIRVLTTREGVDMPKMRECYKEVIGKDMIQDIKDDTSGEYQKIVVALASGD